MSKTINLHTPVVVGVGASAGGLEAFQQLLKGLPENHSLVIVLVQHLDPDHESLMPELVAARTKSPVHSVTDGMQIEQGHIYLMPPGYEMEIDGLSLRLKAFNSPRGLRRPIDRFFTSLSKVYGEHAAAVVLSGTGSDGANGAREVKGQGGLVLVQDPKQAKYDGMPQSVLDMSGADVTASAEEIIDVVRDYFSLRVDQDGGFGSDEEFLDRIMRHVRFRTGHDFAEYKEATMLRRVAVRMSVLNLTSGDQYLKYIVETKNEADLLFRDLLINVTSFFRDTEHFDTLKKTIIPKLVETTEEHGELRFWVAGCSTGEEAYSIGMLVAEEISRVDKKCKVVIFGTDIDEQALNAARLGRYPDGIVESVPEDLLERYFNAMQDGYEVGSHLREMVRFSRHSFIKDPPFSRLDMVSCRNVLIYLKDSLQDLTCRVFHYALREGGYLFLGPSENPNSMSKHFNEINTRSRLFMRKPGRAKPLSLGSLSSVVMDRSTTVQSGGATKLAVSETERVLLDEFAPAYLHVDSDDNVLFASKNAGQYLAVRGGKITTKLFHFVAPELEATFRRVSRVRSSPGSTAEFEFQGELQGTPQRLIVTARRLTDGSQIFVLRDNLQLLDTRPGVDENPSNAQAGYVRQLEAELDDAKLEVRTTVEELETSNEELKSSNEEMMSMNEELQSANEELTTINDELQEKLRELNQANVDMNNYVQSARVPTVFLDADLKLLRFTPEATDYFRFANTDVGRSLIDLSAEIEHEHLLELCALTIEDSKERVEEFDTKDNKHSLVIRIMPFSPDGLSARGVIFTLQDVTDLRDAVEAADEAKSIAEEKMDEVEQIYKTSPLAMGLISKDMVYLRLNQKLAEINGVPLEQHINRTVRDIIPTVADHTEKLVNQVLETKLPILGQRVEGATKAQPEIHRIWESDWLPFYAGGELTGVSVNVREITDQVEIARNLRQIMGELEHRVKNMLANVNALVNRAAKEATTDRDVFETLMKRIKGLANTHALLTAEAWSSASLYDVIAPETIEVYGEDRVTIAGPKVLVTAEATLALGMAIHELATNAAKYGAFSAPDGHVDISWSRISDAKSDRLAIVWKETGGPDVKEPGTAGFGSQLITSTLEGALDGEVEKTWEPNGLRVVIAIGYNEITGNKD